MQLSERERALLTFAAQAPGGEIWIQRSASTRAAPLHETLSELAAKQLMTVASQSGSTARWAVTKKGRDALGTAALAL